MQKIMAWVPCSYPLSMARCCSSSRLRIPFSYLLICSSATRFMQKAQQRDLNALLFFCWDWHYLLGVSSCLKARFAFFSWFHWADRFLSKGGDSMCLDGYFLIKIALFLVPEFKSVVLFFVFFDFYFGRSQCIAEGWEVLLKLKKPT